MEKVEASKLARGLGVVLERVMRGESFEVVRYGRVVAEIRPATNDAVRPQTARPVVPQFIKAPLVDAVSPPNRLTGSAEALDRQSQVDKILAGSRRAEK